MRNHGVPLIDLPADVTVVIVPGLHDSSPSHWQSLWERQLPQVRRVAQHDWCTPKRGDWVGRLAATLEATPGRILVVAHSLGCITTVHLPQEAAARIEAALLVAPADPERRALLYDFAPAPSKPLPYRSIVVGSRNDPWCTARLSGCYARAWGSDFLLLRDAGHINVESGHGQWPLGLALLAGLARPQPRSSGSSGGLVKRAVSMPA